MPYVTNTLQIVLSLIIWIFFISAGAKAGLDLTTIEDSKEFVAPAPRLLNVALALFSLCMGSILYYKYMNAKNPLSFFGKTANKIFGDGFSEAFKNKLNFHILCPLFFLTIGFVGLLNALISNAPGSVFYEILVPFSFGIGMVLPHVMKKLFTMK